MTKKYLLQKKVVFIKGGNHRVNSCVERFNRTLIVPALQKRFRRLVFLDTDSLKRCGVPADEIPKVFYLRVAISSETRQSILMWLPSPVN